MLYAPVAWFFELNADERRRLMGGTGGVWRRVTRRSVPDTEVNE